MNEFFVEEAELYSCTLVNEGRCALSVIELFFWKGLLHGVNAGFVASFKDVHIAVSLFAHYNHFELHLIACESACLIGKDVLHLAEFLINGTCKDLERFIVVLYIQLVVAFHKVGLSNFYELQRHNKGDWNHCIEEKEVACPLQEELRRAVLLDVLRHIVFIFVVAKCYVHEGYEEAASDLHQKHYQ